MRSANRSTRMQFESLESRDAPTVVPIGNEFRVNNVTAWVVDEPAVALDGDGDFVVAWQAMNADGSDNAIFVRRYSKDGIELSGDIQVNTFTDRFATTAECGRRRRELRCGLGKCIGTRRLA